jgi:hypothetical protein
MKLKPALITIPVTTVVCIILNGVFHVPIMGNFFNTNLAAFGAAANKIAESNPAWQVATELVWVSALFYLLTFTRPQKLSLGHAVTGGMLMNASVSGTWNFINASLFSAFPKNIILPDMTFHILIVGPAAGLLIALLYNRYRQ